jgi:hypothetical protein
VTAGGPVPGVGWRDVGIPTEHGGWSFTLEPVALGLITAPSPAGIALGVAALLAFLARTPLKIVLVDRARRRRLERTRMAGRVALVYALLLVGAVVVATATAAGPFWGPLALAAPLIGIELWYDARSRSRRLVPELAGTVGIGSIAAAIGLAGGVGGVTAAGLWLVAAGRAVAAVPFVRVQLRRLKSQAYRRWESDAAQLAVMGVGWAGWMLGAIPAAAAVALFVLGIAHLVLVRASVPPVAVLGAQQVVLGLGMVLTAGLGFRAP